MAATTTAPLPPAIAPLKSRALLFGLNYAYDPNASLQGCINDVVNMGAYLREQYPGIDCRLVTDDVDRAGTSAQGMISKLYELAVASHSNSLDFVYIHYSGHGSYVRDRSGDERDRQDECLVPSDYATAGMVSDDILQSLFRSFNPKTRVVCVFDCCHSGTIGDVKYSWESPTRVSVENISCAVRAKVMTLSGCLDMQTSADAFNVLKDNKYVGAMTACLLIALREQPRDKADVFAALGRVRMLLRQRGFSQVPRLCTSHNLARDKIFLP